MVPFLGGNLYYVILTRKVVYQVVFGWFFGTSRYKYNTLATSSLFEYSCNPNFMTVTVLQKLRQRAPWVLNGENSRFFHCITRIKGVGMIYCAVWLFCNNHHPCIGRRHEILCVHNGIQTFEKLDSNFCQRELTDD